jgi:hypothetical protein
MLIQDPPDPTRSGSRTLLMPNPKKNMVYTVWDPMPEELTICNLTLCPLQSRLQHIYHGQPYARVDFIPRSGTLDLASVCFGLCLLSYTTVLWLDGEKCKSLLCPINICYDSYENKQKIQITDRKSCVGMQQAYAEMFAGGTS